MLAGGLAGTRRSALRPHPVDRLPALGEGLLTPPLPRPRSPVFFVARLLLSLPPRIGNPIAAQDWEERGGSAHRSQALQEFFGRRRLLQPAGQKLY